MESKNRILYKNSRANSIFQFYGVTPGYDSTKIINKYRLTAIKSTKILQKIINKASSKKMVNIY